MSTPISILLTTRDLAARWQVSPGHLANMRSAGVGPAFRRFGTAVRYSLADIEAYERAAAVTTHDQRTVAA